MDTPAPTWRARGMTTTSYGAITAATFDHEEELLWVGDSYGYAMGFSASLPCQELVGWHAYSSFHSFREPCVDLVSANSLLYSCGPSTIRLSRRGGACVGKVQVKNTVQRKLTQLQPMHGPNAGIVFAGETPGTFLVHPDRPSDITVVPATHMTTALNKNVQYLVDCRPLTSAMGTAIALLKYHVGRLPADLEFDAAQERVEALIDDFIADRIDNATRTIAQLTAARVVNDDVVLVFGNPGEVAGALVSAWRDRGVRFRAIVVDSRPQFAARELLSTLTDAGIPCTYVLLTGLGYVMKEATKVMLDLLAQ